MIALDTNILIALHRSDVPGHASAIQAYQEAGGDNAPWVLPWPCVHEFIGIATHPRIFSPPSKLDQAVEAISRWRTRPRVRLLTEDDAYWSTLVALLAASGTTGPRIHDARIAALCLHHEVRELWTADRDFSRFPRLRTRNPLVPATLNG